MAASIPTRNERQRRAQARELARTPVVDPYRGQLSDPYGNRRFGEVEREVRPDTPMPAVANARQIAEIATRFSHVRLARSPQAAVLATVIGFVLAAAMAVYGLGLFFLVFAQEAVGNDQSFSPDNNTQLVVMAFVDLVVAAGFVTGAVALTGGRILGRIVLTLSGFGCLGLAIGWIQRDSGIMLAGWVPASSAVASFLMLVLLYLPEVTRWLGVLPPPQPR